MRVPTTFLAALLALCFLGACKTRAIEEPDAETVPAVADEDAWALHDDSEVQPVMTELITEHGAVQPGDATKVGVHFEIEPGWHIYAQNPGDVGLPTKVLWERARHVTFGPLVWPLAELHTDPGNIHTHGYSGTVVLYSPVTVSRSARPGEVLPIHAKAEWLACQEICIPGTAELSLALPVVDQPPPRSAHAELFDQVR